MIEAFNSYYALFTILFTFIFVFLQEEAIDKIISLISGPKCTQFGKWINNKVLYKYSQSTRKSNFKWLRIILSLLIFLCPLFTLTFSYYFISCYILGIIIIILILASPSLIKLTCKNLIFPSPTELIIIIILTALNIVYHKPEYLFEHEVLQEKDIVPYLVPMFMISFLVKAISLLIFLTINSLISCSKYFTKLLLKHNNPSKYIAKYVLTASSSFFLALLGTKLITWGKIALLDIFNNFMHTYLML